MHHSNVTSRLRACRSTSGVIFVAALLVCFTERLHLVRRPLGFIPAIEWSRPIVRANLHSVRKAATSEISGDGGPGFKEGDEGDGVMAVAKDKDQEADLKDAGFMPVLMTRHIFASLSPVHGWGVFAAKDFEEHELVHESPGRLIEGRLRQFEDVIFELGWEEENADTKGILGLGFASLHNHHDDPNVGQFWEKSERHDGAIVGTFYALRPIARGEELLISYGEDWWKTRNLTAS
eukprot:TRINITY_DN9498_c0_g1_i1.p1 TRINITY_DN9498_c0_g1~~TRINITY_DN9498_c0_g1_i1.p1  ORF type:complete len:235 (+),score=46.24 TRINITY_DN9498_c0_g1_i1:96-800(+)